MYRFSSWTRFPWCPCSLNLAYIHLRVEELFGSSDWFGSKTCCLWVIFFSYSLSMDTLYLKRSLKSHCSTNSGVQHLSTSGETSSLMTSSPSMSVKRKMPNFQQCWIPYAVAIQLLKPLPPSRNGSFKGASQTNSLIFGNTEEKHATTSTLGRLSSEVHELPCTDEVDETCNPSKWTKKTAEKLAKVKDDCNMTAGLEAKLLLAVGARVIDTNTGLVNGAL